MHTQQAYRALFAILLLTLLSVAGIAMPYPILSPLMLGDTANALNQFLGLPPKLLLAVLLSGYPLGMLVGSSFIGSLSDVYGRKNTLLVSTICSGLSYFATALAIYYQQYVLLLCARIITGMCEGNVSVGRSISVDLHPVIDKTRSLSWIYAVTYSGWLLGPLAGGYLMQFGAETAFIIAGMLMVLALGTVVFFIQETNTNKRAPDKLNQASQGQQSIWALAVRNNSFTLLRRKTMRHVFFLYLFVMLGLNAFYEYYAVWLVETFNYDSIGIGHTTATLTLFMIIVSALIVERAKQWLGMRHVISFGLALFAVTLYCSVWVEQATLVWFFASCGAAISLFNALLPLFFSESVSSDEQGKLFGLTTSTFCLGSFSIALVGGAISLIGAVWTIVSGGIFITIGLLYFNWFATHIAASPSPANQ